ncbi:MAG: hypothetical protein WEB90_02850 [Gemmatimonadota bacterium]
MSPLSLCPLWYYRNDALLALGHAAHVHHERVASWVATLDEGIPDALLIP